MAVGFPTPPLETDAFVHRQQRWYSTQIENAHAQLRHLASSPAPNIIYHVNNKELYMINTANRTKTHVAHLPFEPRCITTGHGYFLAGDEKGCMAYSQIPHSEHPLEHLQLAEHDATSFPGATAVMNPTMYQIGTDIVNSISIHKIERSREEFTDQIVAITTNNDKRVKMFHLGSGEERLIGQFSTPMNHATISPDGSRLVIVGDEDTIHFYKRVDTNIDGKNEAGIVRVVKDGWFKWSKHKTLRIPSGPELDSLAFFTTAWNDQGSLCATASEGGYITVFNVDRIDDAEDAEDCIAAFVPSSRPQSAAGAVRSMVFTPAPWDFLIWAENNGRMCVGDLRHQLVKRQTIKIDPHSGHVDHIPLSDKDGRQNSQGFYIGSDFVYRPWNEEARESTGLSNSDIDEMMNRRFGPPSHPGLRVGENAGRDSLNRSDSALPRDPIQGLAQREQEMLQNLRVARAGELGRSILANNFLDSENDGEDQRWVPHRQNLEALDRSALNSLAIPGLESTMAVARERFLESVRLDGSSALLPYLSTNSDNSNPVPRRRDFQTESSEALPSSSGSNERAPAQRTSNTESNPSPGSRPRRRLSTGYPYDDGNQTNDNQGSSSSRRELRGIEILPEDRDDEFFLELMREGHRGARAVAEDREQGSAERNSRGVNVNLPQNRTGESRSRVPLPSVRDTAPLSQRTPDVQDTLPRPLDNLASTNVADLPVPRYNGRGQIIGWSRPQSARRTEIGAGRMLSDEFTRLMRTTGTFRGSPLHLIDAQEAAAYRHTFAYPRNRTELADRGVGTEGVMIEPRIGWQPDGKHQQLNEWSRTVFIATDEGILEVNLDFYTRRFFPGWEWVSPGDV